MWIYTINTSIRCLCPFIQHSKSVFTSKLVYCAFIPFSTWDVFRILDPALSSQRPHTHADTQGDSVFKSSVAAKCRVWAVEKKKGKSKGWETCRKSHSFVAFDCAVNGKRLSFISPLDDLRSLCTCSGCKYFQNCTLKWAKYCIFIHSECDEI